MKRDDPMRLVTPGSHSARGPSAPWPEQDRAIYSPTGLPPGIHVPPTAPIWNPDNQPSAPLFPGDNIEPQPASYQPASYQPASYQPNSNQPNSNQPASNQPGSLDPASLQPAPADQPQDQDQYSQFSYQTQYLPQSNTPILYTTELIIFGFVGWAWLAVREYIGQTPVLDATVILSTLVCSCLNLIGVLFFPSPQDFAPFAQGFFSHSLVVALLYAYGLSESTAIGSPTVSCGTSNSTVSSLYAQAYFGGLTLHQIPACITMAYLVVILLLSAAQASACLPLPRRWFLRGIPQSTSAFLLLHLCLFSLSVPLADPMTPFASLLLALTALHVLCLIDLSWALGLLFPESRHRLSIIQGAIEMGLVGLSAVLSNLYAAIIFEDNPSPALLIIFTFLLLLSVLLFGNELSRPSMAVPSGSLPSAPRKGPHLDLRGFLARPRAPPHEGKNK
jgi:hypothetical protein